MSEEERELAKALERFVAEELRLSSEAADYNNEAVQIVDARNHLFRNAGRRGTDEEQGVYALRELCRVNEDTLETIPDSGRIAAVTRALLR